MTWSGGLPITKQIRLREMTTSATSISSTAKSIHPLHQIVYLQEDTFIHKNTDRGPSSLPSMGSMEPDDFQHPFWAETHCKAGQNKTEQRPTLYTHLRTRQSHTMTKNPPADRHSDEPRTSQPPNRDQCEHCGEAGRNTTVRCRHGGPITCLSFRELGTEET